MRGLGSQRNSRLGSLCYMYPNRISSLGPHRWAVLARARKDAQDYMQVVVRSLQDNSLEVVDSHEACLRIPGSMRGVAKFGRIIDEREGCAYEVACCAK